ncbi:MAG: hypothetical protein HKO59_07545, partial [Phycisphaerales bacterium]|nr:hypothetical protein [Phycisphaerales bacterium]
SQLGSLILDVDCRQLDGTFLNSAGQVRDTFTIEKPPALAADIDCDGDVDFSDLLGLVSSWGPCPLSGVSCAADVTGDGTVDFEDLLALLAAWS